jgi:hypothetical protein
MLKLQLTLDLFNSAYDVTVLEVAPDAILHKDSRKGFPSNP